MSGPPPGYAAQVSDWALRYEGYDPAEEGLREALCVVGNGYMATRGAAPEATADGVHYPGTYAAGVYNRLRSEVAGEVVENESLVNLPNWLPVTFRVDDGPFFAVDAVDLLEHHQELDLRRAVLTRRFRFRDDAGRTTTVTQRRFVSMAWAHACALEVTVVAEDWSGRLTLRSGLDGTVRNTLVERYRDLDSGHLDLVDACELSDDSVLLEVETNQSHVRVAMAARTTLWREDAPLAAHRTLVHEGAWIGHDVAVDVREGDAVTLEKSVTVFTGRDRPISEPAVAASRWLPRLGRFDELLSDHVLAWSHLWERFHIELGSDADVLRIIRLHVLHLLQTVSANTDDLDVGVPARGLHGEAYRGHILWDELFVFPVLNLRIPELTRSLLLYRYRRLPEARSAALAAGYRGAMYPWQSSSDGREESQQLHLNPASGRWLPDPTHRQRHVGIAVAYNVWHYYQATGDEEFLTRYGAEMLLEIARFWGSLATYDRGRDRFVLCGVMGPDEFHSGYPGADWDGIDNNAYTNVMAVWVLQRALGTLELLAEQPRRELLETLAVDPEELDRWEAVSRKMFVPFDDDGILSQFEGYADLEELDWDGYRARYEDIHRLDRILEAEGDSVNRYKASKQADALMLFYLLSADELRDLLGDLGYRLEPEAIPRTIDHYLARTSHGSTLSSVVHAWVLARSQRERAVEFFCHALKADVADIQGGTTPEGIHLAAMAGSIDLLQRCFAGLETRGEALVLNPYWPEELDTLEFTVRYRDTPLLIRVRGVGVSVASGAGARHPIEVTCRGQSARLEPASTVRFPL